jgi:hypothetical protein
MGLGACAYIRKKACVGFDPDSYRQTWSKSLKMYL